MDEAELKQKVMKDLKIATISARIWAALCKKRLVREVLNASEFDREACLENLEDEYRFLSEFARGALADRHTRQIVEDANEGNVRLDALASMFVLEAERLQAVRDFRQRHLRDGLLPSTDVATWIATKHKDDGEASEGELLHYFDGERLQAVRVRPHGVLDELHRACALLNRSFSWTSAQAVHFVLTGVDLGIPKMRAAIRHVGPLATLSRIILEIDPHTSPQEVQKLYSTARQHYRKGRDKDISQKHATLAVFAAEQELRVASSPTISYSSVRAQEPLTGPHEGLHIRADLSRIESVDDNANASVELKWRHQLEIWNDRYPDWTYTGENCVKHFARDVRVAWERVTERPWVPPNDLGDETGEA